MPTAPGLHRAADRRLTQQPEAMMGEKSRERDDSGERTEREPRSAREQDAPEPERPERVDEAAGEGLQELEDPPQAEGDRDEE